MNLAPRKPDWDLKRDIAKKLEKLERRTQRAIAELIRDRLQNSDQDLALVVNAGEAIARTEEDEDD
ncbi:coiled-coil domain-containing protein 12 [Mytilus galloprovincialis]|nr:coiled-coil domain-containing protein 12 [Mytilus galloprovincialis]